MNNKNDGWKNNEEHGEPTMEAMRKMLEVMERKAKQHINYMLLEGFITNTDTPGVYEYTPEGQVLVQQQYKKLREQGLI